MDNLAVIVMPIFGVKYNEQKQPKISLNSIINYGLVNNDVIEYITKDGKQKCSFDNPPESIMFFKFKDLDFKELMWRWNKQNNNTKPFVLDWDINTFEEYEGRYSRLKIMIERRENEIAIKPIID